jgi:hypothetical protein
MTRMARLHPDVNLPVVLKTPWLDLAGTPKIRKGNNLLIIVRNEGTADSGPFKIIVFSDLADVTPDNSYTIDIPNLAAGGTQTFTPSDGHGKAHHFDTGLYYINIFGDARTTVDHGALAWTQDLLGV